MLVGPEEDEEDVTRGRVFAREEAVGEVNLELVGLVEVGRGGFFRLVAGEVEVRRGVLVVEGEIGFFFGVWVDDEVEKDEEEAIGTRDTRERLVATGFESSDVIVERQGSELSESTRGAAS